MNLSLGLPLKTNSIASLKTNVIVLLSAQAETITKSIWDERCKLSPEKPEILEKRKFQTGTRAISGYQLLHASVLDTNFQLLKFQKTTFI